MASLFGFRRPGILPQTALPKCKTHAFGIADPPPKGDNAIFVSSFLERRRIQWIGTMRGGKAGLAPCLHRGDGGRPDSRCEKGENVRRVRRVGLARRREVGVEFWAFRLRLRRAGLGPWPFRGQRKTEQCIDTELTRERAHYEYW